MKKAAFPITAILINIFFITIISASASVKYSGKYKNKHVKFTAAYISSDLMYQDRRTGRARVIVYNTVKFFITSKPGFKLINKSSIKFKGKIYKFKGIEYINQFYKYGKIKFKGKIKNNDTLILTYYIYNVSNKTKQRVIKNLKIIIPRNTGINRNTIKMIIKEY